MLWGDISKKETCFEQRNSVMIFVQDKIRHANTTTKMKSHSTWKTIISEQKDQK